MKIELEVMGIPEPIKIHRFTIAVKPSSQQHGTRFGKGRFYNDKGKAKYIDHIRDSFLRQWDGKPMLLGPCGLYVFFHMEPTSYLTEEGAAHWAYEGPDTDNMLKSVKDAATKAGIWKDDGQVFFDLAMKTICYDYMGPLMVVELHEFENNRKEPEAKKKVTKRL